MFSQTKIRFTRSRLYKNMAEIRLSQIKSSALKILSYAGPSVTSYCFYLQVLTLFLPINNLPF